jgi:hypothetical protein
MPNHITTRITITGKDDNIKTFKDAALTREVDKHTKKPFLFLDFNKIVPCPVILQEVEESSTSEYAARLIILRGERGAPFETMGMYDSQIKRIRDEVGMPRDSIHQVAAVYLAKHPDEERQGRLRLQAIMETGFASWYPWNIKHWGTKWNSYSFSIVEDCPGRFVIKFDTAWGFAHPVFRKMAEMFPELRFEAVAFDEGWNFATKGHAQGADYQIQDIEATEELYIEVYGHAPERDEEESA